MSGKAKSLAQVNFMVSNLSPEDKSFEPEVKLMYRRPQSRDKYECITDVLDDILIRLEQIEIKLQDELRKP
jgi:hypothetical protein